MTNATPTGSVCPLRRPPKGKDHPSASRTAFFGLPPDSRNPSSPQPSRLLDSPHHHADGGLADEKSGLAGSALSCTTQLSSLGVRSSLVSGAVVAGLSPTLFRLRLTHCASRIRKKSAPPTFFSGLLKIDRVP